VSARVGTRLALAAALLGLLGSACSGKTKQAGGLELIVSTDMPTPARFDEIHVNIQQEGAGGTWTQPPLLDAFYPLGTVAGETALPTTIALVAGRSPYQEVLVTVTGLQRQGTQGGTTVVERVIETQVPTDRLAELPVVLASICAGVICQVSGDSCQPEAVGDAGAGSCAPPTVIPASALGGYQPGDGSDAGVATTPGDGGASSSDGDSTIEPQIDAGAETGADATEGADDGEASASMPIGDGSPDAPGCTDVCIEGQTECASGGAQKCEQGTNGCTAWVPTANCGANQTCVLGDAGAACTCVATLCTANGTACEGSAVATCATDDAGCLYVSGTPVACVSPNVCAGTSPSAKCSPVCSDTCTQGQSGCVSGELASCTQGSNRCWTYGTPAACPSAYQTCTGSAGVAACTCKTDPVCSTVGPTCASPSSVVTCSRDAQGCFFQSSSPATCSNGACSGAAGAAACCTNTCTTSGTAPACLTTSSTEIETCALGSNGCLAETPVACGSGLVCERYGAAACVDPNWAEWPMPNDTTADPGAPNAMSYTDNGDGTVADNVTGLVWQQAVPSGTYTWGSASTSGTAQSYCATLALAGYSDWRLPSVEELTSLMDPGLSPPINSTYFPGPPSAYWSSVPLAGSSGNAWYVSFAGNGMNYSAMSVSSNVRCVR
jgi:hypothetical protein